jgi:hypothetical protein
MFMMLISSTVGFEFFVGKVFASSGSSNSSIELFRCSGDFYSTSFETVKISDFFRASAGFLGTSSN